MLNATFLIHIIRLYRTDSCIMFVCLSVCLLVTFLSLAKTAELVEMQFVG